MGMRLYNGADWIAVRFVIDFVWEKGSGERREEDRMREKIGI